MSRQTRFGLVALILVLIAVIAPIRQRLDLIKYNPKYGFAQKEGPRDARKTGMLLETSLQFAGAAEMGLREAVASMLWVRADEFFHNGEYEAILPLVRMVTWLDPQQIDVYSTGAWHLDYNFTDEEQRSDRRYIPPAIALLKEGIENNPEIWDLRFDLGWMHYLQKLKDYPNAAYWLKEAASKDGKDMNTGEIQPRPSFVDRMLAHAYERTGEFDKCEAQWKSCVDKAEAAVKKDKDGSTIATLDVDVAKKNYGLFLLRQAWRYGDMDVYARGLAVLKSIEKPDYKQAEAYTAAQANYDQLKAKGQRPHDVLPPLDAGFTVTWKKLKPKVLRVSGTLDLATTEQYKNLDSECYTNRYQEYMKSPEKQRKYLAWQNGCRVRIVLEDEGYDYLHMKDQKEFQWQVDKTLTLMVDEAAVRDGKFSLDINMNDTEQNSTMYPFVKKNYRLSVWFNPQDAPDFIQDRIGWRGEGLTDKHYLDTKSIPGVRMLRREFTLKRSDIL